MRLTADLINSSLSYLNPLKERELDLRGHRIPTIENLGVGVARETDALDLSDNDITTLSNFPLNTRLRSLYCARNRINSIAPTLSRSIPTLSTLALGENNVAELADLVPLEGFKRLVHLTLIDNPVAMKENYRYFVISLVPSLRFLDFSRVKDTERVRARDLFGSVEQPSDLAVQIRGERKERGAAVVVNGGGKSRTKMTDEEKEKVRNMIKNAGSLAEIARLEKMIAEGRIPV